MRGFALTAVLTAAMAMNPWAASSEARAEQFRYTPETCSTNADGKVYLRLNTGVAFGFPADALKHLRGAIDYEPPPVPNPDDPEGCPGNPILTQSAYLLFHFPRSAETPTGEFAPDLSLLFSIGGAEARLFDNDGYVGSQGSSIRLYRKLREAGKWCESTPAGWNVCYGAVERPENPTDFGAFYVAEQDIHPLRSGAPLSLQCWPPHPGGDRECSTTYQPLPRIRMSVRFTDNLIPVEQFFDLDRAITAWLKATRVPELDFEPPEHILHRNGGTE